MYFLPDIPLLKKELAEQSSQFRTYVIRGLFGLLLYVGGLMLIYGNGGNVRSDVSLGAGRELFWNVVYLEALAIYLFLPAMTAGALAGEKERESLSLLLLTTLPPWSILVQKLLSRLIPILSLVVISFPLLAAAYSFGGVPRDELWQAGMLLVIWAVQLSAISLACSSYARTTVSALVMTYLITALIFFFYSSISTGMARGGGSVNSYVPFVRVGGEFQLNSSPQGVFRCLFLTGTALVAARICLFSRAFSPPSNAMLKFLRAVDHFWNDLNSVTGGVVLVDDKNRWPQKHPISWRETSKKSLGTFRYLFRVLVLIETPILVICQMTQATGTSGVSSVSYLLYITWGIGTALVCVHAASVISGERARQTLDSLLTAPITGADIVREKLSGVRRLLFVLAVPMLTIIVFQHWFRDYYWQLQYLVRSVSLMIVMLMLLMWTCAFVGLRTRTQLQAIVTAMTVLILMVGIPKAVSYFLVSVLQWNDALGAQIAFLSPASLIQYTELGWDDTQFLGNFGVRWESEYWFWIPVGFWALVALAIRFACLSNADRWLGRVPPSRTAPRIETVNA
ncbi:MAG: ABC transporter permease subunit [Planctomycetaceae bacterium]|nr:ABC transporter permease subunit [Planctomycetaceae bacterium]MCB9954221.1 ABC transporter permease subunit [Planctomycetaceae bacterium]